MKKTISIIITLCLLICLAACAQSDEKIKAVRNAVFDKTELTVTLGANKSTGYEWDYKIYGDCIEPSINRSFKLTGSKGDATGEVSIGFEGIKEGNAVIVFVTPNGWDGTGEGDAYSVNVSVDTDGTIISATGENGNNAPDHGVEGKSISSAPYAEMLKSKDYQYSYPLTYEGVAYTVTIAAKNGMFCRKVVSNDSSYSVRVVTVDGKAWQVDDLKGSAFELSAEDAAGEMQPDYSSSLRYIKTDTKDDGTITEAYSFEYLGSACNFVFVLNKEGKLAELITTINGITSQIEIIEMKSPSDETLFEI